VIARQGQWSELRKLQYIKDKAGVTWKLVAHRSDGTWGAVNAEGKKLIIPPKPSDTPVTILEPTTEEAVETLQKELGAIPEAIRDGETGILRVRPFPPAKRTAINLDLARSHLFLMHGIYVGDVKGMKEMVEAHEYGHEDPEKGAYVPHEHES
jgi:hypothetical protein